MFTLKWSEATLDALADIYTDSPVEMRERMAGAVEKLNARLKNAPLAEGESRSGAGWIIFVAGPAILFTVNTAARAVYVTRVTRYGN